MSQGGFILSEEERTQEVTDKEQTQGKETVESSSQESPPTSQENGKDATTKESSEEVKKEEEKKEEMVSIPKSEHEKLQNAKKIADEEVKRARADALNFRKRVEKEKASYLEYASASVLSKLLPLSDDLVRLLENGKEEIPEQHYNAIKTLEQRVDSIYEAENVKLIQITKGRTAFDPRFHEAVFALESPEHPPNIIIDVTAPGFVKGDRVLRAAKVVISKAKEVPNETKNDGGSDGSNDDSTSTSEQSSPNETPSEDIKGSDSPAQESQQ